MHYLIHADDMPGREHEQPDVVSRYAALAPRNPHALHMPTHIYTRLGEWDRVVAGNLRAAEAALEHPVEASGWCGRVPPCRRVRGLRLSPAG